MLHKPHPGNIVKSYALKQVFEDLKEADLIVDNSLTKKNKEEENK